MNDSATDALIYLLQEWAAWHRGSSPHLGYPRRAVGLSGYGSNSFDDLCDEADVFACRAVDASVDDLPAHQKAAVLKRYGIAAVFRWQRPGAYESALMEAHEALATSLRKKGVFHG